MLFPYLTNAFKIFIVRYMMKEITSGQMCQERYMIVIPPTLCSYFYTWNQFCHTKS